MFLGPVQVEESMPICEKWLEKKKMPKKKFKKQTCLSNFLGALRNTLAFYHIFCQFLWIIKRLKVLWRNIQHINCINGKKKYSVSESRVSYHFLFLIHKVYLCSTTLKTLIYKCISKENLMIWIMRVYS